MKDRPIHSTHIVPAISEEASGPSYSVVRLCDALITQNCEVALAALDWGPMASKPTFLKTFPLGIGPRRLGTSPAMKHWLNEQAQSGQIDLLHNHGMWQLNAIYPGWAAKRNGINYVMSPRGAFSEWAFRHGSLAKKLFWPLLQRPSFQATSCFHATSEQEYTDIRRLGFRQPVAVIPNGIDIPEPILKREGRLRTILFLGRIHPKKGIDLLLKAWRAVQGRFPEWRLVIVGSDDGYYGKTGYLDEVQNLGQRLCLTRVEFPGELYGSNKLQAYGDAELFILPTYSENFGMTVAEALAAGTPAIVTKGAPWRGLETQQAGWWIDIGVDPLVACLEQALSCSPSDLEMMGLRGRHWMENDFSWAHIGVQMAETYRWLLDKSLPLPGWVRTD